jgi:hypothetical protein
MGRKYTLRNALGKLQAPPSDSARGRHAGLGVAGLFRRRTARTKRRRSKRGTSDVALARRLCCHRLGGRDALEGTAYESGRALGVPDGNGFTVGEDPLASRATNGRSIRRDTKSPPNQLARDFVWIGVATWPNFCLRRSSSTVAAAKRITLVYPGLTSDRRTTSKLARTSKSAISDRMTFRHMDPRVELRLTEPLPEELLRFRQIVNAAAVWSHPLVLRKYHHVRVLRTSGGCTFTETCELLER